VDVDKVDGRVRYEWGIIKRPKLIPKHALREGDKGEIALNEPLLASKIRVPPMDKSLL